LPWERWYGCRLAVGEFGDKSYMLRLSCTYTHVHSGDPAAVALFFHT
jgi:hypothetical protein